MHFAVDTNGIFHRSRGAERSFFQFARRIFIYIIVSVDLYKTFSYGDKFEFEMADRMMIARAVYAIRQTDHFAPFDCAYLS
jgi:hypothetical protein